MEFIKLLALLTPSSIAPIVYNPASKYDIVCIFKTGIIMVSKYKTNCCGIYLTKSPI